MTVDNDYENQEWTLGHWKLQYQNSSALRQLPATNADGTHRDISVSLQRGDIFATFFVPMLTANLPGPAEEPVMDEIAVHLDLTDAEIVQSERTPATLVNGSQVS